MVFWECTIIILTLISSSAADSGWKSHGFPLPFIIILVLMVVTFFIFVGIILCIGCTRGFTFRGRHHYWGRGLHPAMMAGPTVAYQPPHSYAIQHPRYAPAYSPTTEPLIGPPAGQMPYPTASYPVVTSAGYSVAPGYPTRGNTTYPFQSATSSVPSYPVASDTVNSPPPIGWKMGPQPDNYDKGSSPSQATT